MSDKLSNWRCCEGPLPILNEEGHTLKRHCREQGVLADGSAETARAVPFEMLVDSGFHVAASTSQDVILSARLPLVLDSTDGTTPLSPSRALASGTATYVVAGIAKSSKNIGACLSFCTYFSEDTADSFSDLYS